MLVVLVPGLAMALAERRVALVVGNSAYTHFDPLPNAARDARDIAGALEARGFEVTLLLDAAHPDFAATLDRFARRSAGADVALFYFSGHGFQMNGVNYLAPVGAAITRADQIDSHTLRLDDVIAQVSAPGRRSIILLDACRNDPLPLALRDAGAPGLAVPETGRDTFVAFATQPGNLTFDGIEGQNSPFTQALLHHMGTEGQPIAQMMIAVRNQVEARTAGRQVPWDQSSLTVPFFFNPFQPSDSDLEELAAMSPAMQERILQIWRTQGAQIAQPDQIQPDQIQLAQTRPVAATQPEAIDEAELPDFSAALIFLDEPGPAESEVAGGAAGETGIAPESETATRIAPVSPAPPPVQTALAAQEPGQTQTLTQTRPPAQAPQPAPARAQDQALDPARPRRDVIALAALPQPDPLTDPLVGITRALPLAQLSARQALASGVHPFRPDAPIAWLAALPPAHRPGPLPGVQRIIGIDVTPPEAEPTVPPMTALELAIALQTELQRVGCYRSGIDGQWGPGSRRALRDYLSNSGQRVTSEEPSPEILEQVRLTPDTVCAAPVARTTPAPTQTRTQTRTQAPAPAPPAQAPAPPPPQAPASDRLDRAIRTFR